MDEIDGWLILQFYIYRNEIFWKFGFKGYWEKMKLDDKWELNDEIK